MQHEDQQASAEAIAEAFARILGRDQQLDSQLPASSFAGNESLELVAQRDGTVHALGTISRVSLTPDHPDALWGACQRSELQLRWDGDAAAVGEVLDRWIADAAIELGAAGDWESSLEIEVPSRDSELVLPLLQRGFVAVGIVGVRLGLGAGRDGTNGAGTGTTDVDGDAAAAEQAALGRLEAAGVALRQATLADAPLLGEMDSELLQHDALHGAVEARDGAAAVLQRGIEERLAIDPEWTWVIEQHGDAVGYLSLETRRDRHDAKCAAGPDIAYIQAMYLRPTVRGGGIGEAVVHFAHARAQLAGFGRMLLGYAALNPRSGPFWCRMGYRPLYTSWQRRPALRAG